jgi:hypothetical protein
MSPVLTQAPSQEELLKALNLSLLYWDQKSKGARNPVEIDEINWVRDVQARLQAAVDATVFEIELEPFED